MMWFPKYIQMRLWSNPNYLNSLWLGTVWLVLLLPEIIHFYYKALMAMRPVVGFYIAPVVILLSVMKLILNGVFGRLSAENISDAEAVKRLQDQGVMPKDDK